jgi:signal transduction histidine kinase
VTRWGRMGLRTRARVAYGTVAVLSLLAMLFAAVTFGQLLDARVRLADRLDPAGLQTREWMSALADEEGDVRDLALTGDPRFLDSARAARRRTAILEEAVRDLLAGEPRILRLVDRFDRLATGWREGSAAPLLERVDRAGPVPASDEGLARSDRAFTDVRRAHLVLLQRALDETRTQARDDLDGHTRDLVVALGSAALIVALGLAGTWLGLNRWVLDPVARLGGDARKVAGGSLQHPIGQSGPPDLRRMGADVEAMRLRIVEELDLVEAARLLLEQQAGDLARSNTELEQFAYVASHDLQEPLRKITGFCQLLQRRYGGQLDERADEYIAFAVDGAKRMQQLINDLLAFSRVGRTTDAFSPVDLSGRAAAALSNLQEAVADARATVEIGELPTVQGDPVLLESLFQNLIGNALKFRSEDPPVVTITSRRVGDEWELACRDNGIGIAPAYAERVFVIFQRLNERDAYTGTGIGLALCRKLVEFHGGRIWVDADEPGTGPGTTVRWTFPVEGPAAPVPPVLDPPLQDVDEPAAEPRTGTDAGSPAEATAAASGPGAP